MIEVEDKGEKDMPHPFVQAMSLEELGRSHAAPPSFGKKKSPQQPHLDVNPY
jgi:hypothetical protein